MALKRLTPIEVAEVLASRSGLTIDQAKALLQAQAQLAYERAADGFAIPGIGVLVLQQSPERKMVMRFGSKAGESITVPAKKNVKFRVSRVAKDMVIGESKPMPDLFKPLQIPEFKSSIESRQPSDALAFLSDLGPNLTLADEEKPATLIVHQLPDFSLSSGRIVAADLLTGAGAPFTRPIPPGRYPLALVVAAINGDERVAFAILRFSSAKVARWEMALIEGQDASTLKKGEFFGYGVDSGTGSFFDASLLEFLRVAGDEQLDFHEQIINDMSPSYEDTRRWVHVEFAKSSMAVFSSGYGDGRYGSYFGIDADGNPAALVTDFGIVDWAGRR